MRRERGDAPQKQPCGTLEPRWTLGRIEAGSRAGAEDPRGPRSVRRRLISKERFRPYGMKYAPGLHAARFLYITARAARPTVLRAARRCRCAQRARRDPRGLFASYSHSRTLDIGDCSVHRVPRQVLRAVACRYSRHGVFDFVRAPLASPQPHSARGGAAPAGHDHRWPRVQKANALYRSISLAAAPRSCMRLRLWQFKP